MIITPHTNGKVSVFKGPNFGLVQTIVNGFNVEVVATNNDHSLMAEAGDDNILRIYSYDGSTYNKIQDINVGFLLRYIVISSQRIFVAGHAFKIDYYSHDGSQYVLSQTISTGIRIYDRGFYSADLSMIAFPESSTSFSVYE